MGSLMNFGSAIVTIACLLTLFVGRTIAAVDVARDEPPIIQSIASDLLYDQNNRLAKHALVYDASNPECQSMIRTKLQKHLMRQSNEADRLQLAALEGSAYDQVLAPHQNEQHQSGCMAACLERGADREIASHVMPNKVYDSSVWDTPQRDITDWFTETCSRVEVCLLSYHSRDHPIEVYWKAPSGEMKHHMSLQYGDKHTRCFHSFLGHQFVAKDESDPANPFVVGDLTIEHITVKVWGESPPSDERAPSHDFDDEIEKTLKYEWKRHERIKRTFSPLGMKRGRLPNDVFASLGAFYYNNANNVAREEWKNKGVYVNWWETDVHFLQIPWAEKKVYQERLKAMVEEWAGVKVEQTMMYGLRQYTEGARLLTHVDRHATHAVSLIVNIAQGNMTEPWPVEVLDHAHRLHEVLMEPGDVVYYESAKCLHSRNRPLTGPNAYYANMFTHYKPAQEGNWWLEENPEGTPEAVLGDLGVEEECRLVKKGLASVENSLGFIEGVECDNPKLGKNISPNLFQAKGPDDLVKWWRFTSPDKGDAIESISSPVFTETRNAEAEL